MLNLLLKFACFCFLATVYFAPAYELVLLVECCACLLGNVWFVWLGSLPNTPS